MLLGVNIDHIATLRNARGGVEPNLNKAAEICKKVNVNGITVHLREDRRHIKDSDLKTLRQIPNLRINLEMAATEEMKEIALAVLPEACCIVPERRQELTTEGGLDVASKVEYMTEFVKELKSAGILVSLFIDPDEKQIEASAKIGSQYIELHTGQYANSFGKPNEEYEFQRLKKATCLAQKLGLKVNAGHGLNYENVQRMHEISGLEELNIGHSIVAHAVFVGFEQAVLEMKQLCENKL